MRRILLYLPTLICFVYAGFVALDAFYVGALASPDVFLQRAKELPPGEPGDILQDWMYRSPGHFFWAGALISSFFVILGLFFKRVLRR